VHGTFLNARLARERAIAGGEFDPPLLFQPGLFDRRSERARVAIQAAEAARQLDRTAALARLEREATLSPTAAELWLVILPDRPA
jgi:hypothetical protein